MSSLVEKNEKRAQFLRLLYEKTNGDERMPVSIWEVGEKLGFNREETDQIRQYLEGEGRIKTIARGYIGITHWGVQQAEVAFEHQQSVESIPEGNRRNIMPDPQKVFVVHGRNEKARRALFEFLRSIRLHPLEWTEALKATGKTSPYVGEVLDAAFSIAQAIVVLMTPDDRACLQEPFRTPDDPPYETQLTPQARPNVLFEAGMAVGRNPERTILVELGHLRPFSDIGGRHLLRLDDTAEKRHELALRLEGAGCPVDHTGTDWLKTGDFTADIKTIVNPAVLHSPKELDLIGLKWEIVPKFFSLFRALESPRDSDLSRI